MAMEDAKAALAWKLSSTASRMCLDLGLHRLPRDDAPDNFKKRMTFWSVYSMDKGLAFNFGRTPTGKNYRCPPQRANSLTSSSEFRILLLVLFQ